MQMTALQSGPGSKATCEVKHDAKCVCVRFDMGGAKLSAEAARRLDVGSVVCLDADADATVAVYVNGEQAAVGSAMTAPGADGEPRLAVSVREVFNRVAGVSPAVSQEKAHGQDAHTTSHAIARAVLVLAAALAMTSSAWAQTTRPAGHAATKAAVTKPAEQETAVVGGAADVEKQRVSHSADGDGKPAGKPNVGLGWPEILQTLLALGVVIVLIFLTRWVLRRMGPRRLAGGSGVMQVLASAPLSGRGQMILVKLGTRLVLVGIIGQTMTALTEITDPSEAAAVAAAAEQQGTDSLKNIFRTQGRQRSPLGQVAQQLKSKLEKKQES